MAEARGSSEQAEIRKQDTGSYSVSGPLTFHSVTRLWRDSQRLFEGDANLRLDFKEVTRSDSAGLALLIEWRRNGARTGTTVEFLNLPDQMMEIAGMTQLDRALLGE